MKKVTQSQYERFITEHNGAHITDGTCFGDMNLKVSFRSLLGLFGQPTVVGSGDSKVQLTWVFDKGEHTALHGHMCPICPDHVSSEANFTIYDWKTEKPIHEINEWNIGRRGLSVEEVKTFLLEKGLKEDEIILQ